MRNHRIIKATIPLLVLSALIFFSESSPVRFFRNSVGLVLKPLMSVVTGANDRIDNSAAESDGRLEAALFQIEELRERVLELEKNLRFKEESGLSLVGARVLLYTKDFGRELLTVDRGRQDGILAGDLVTAEGGLMVGVVREVQDSFSKVSVASNPGETFEVEIVPLGVVALAKGLGARTFSIELVPADLPIKTGDFVSIPVISGGVFAKGASLAMGRVTNEIETPNESFKEVRAVLLADPVLMREVFIIRGGSSK